MKTMITISILSLVLVLATLGTFLWRYEQPANGWFNLTPNIKCDGEWKENQGGWTRCWEPNDPRGWNDGKLPPGEGR